MEKFLFYLYIIPFTIVYLNEIIILIYNKFDNALWNTIDKIEKTIPDVKLKNNLLFTLIYSNYGFIGILFPFIYSFWLVSGIFISFMWYIHFTIISLNYVMHYFIRKASNGDQILKPTIHFICKFTYVLVYTFTGFYFINHFFKICKLPF